MAARIYSLQDFPHADEDSTGQLILWDGEDDDDAVVVQPHVLGWQEVLGAEAVFL